VVLLVSLNYIYIYHYTNNAVKCLAHNFFYSLWFIYARRTTLHCFLRAVTIFKLYAVSCCSEQRHYYCNTPADMQIFRSCPKSVTTKLGTRGGAQLFRVCLFRFTNCCRWLIINRRRIINSVFKLSRASVFFNTLWPI